MTSIRLSFPVDVGSGLKVSPANADVFFRHTEVEHPTGYFPIGYNTVWHGGVHLYPGAPGAPVYCMADGVVVAARLIGEEDPEAKFGSLNFIIVRHTVLGSALNSMEGSGSYTADMSYPYFSMYMHLGYEALAPGNSNLKLVAWLGTEPPYEIEGSVGKSGRNSKADVETIQTMLTEVGEQPGTIDGLIGPKTIGAIRAFQGELYAHPDGRVDVDGKTWKLLYDRVAGSYTGELDEALLGELADGTPIKVNKRITAGQMLWTCGTDANDEAQAMVQWETFSAMNLCEGAWEEVVDESADYPIDTRQILEKFEGSEWIPGEDVVTGPEIAKFYEKHPQAAGLRTKSCKFKSEWAWTTDEMVDAMATRFWTEGLKEKLEPYLFYTPEQVAELALPPQVRWHYNPVAFVKALAEMDHTVVVVEDDSPTPKDDTPPIPVEDNPPTDKVIIYVPEEDTIYILEKKQADELDAATKQIEDAINAILSADDASRAEKKKDLGTKIAKEGLLEVVVLNDDGPPTIKSGPYGLMSNKVIDVEASPRMIKNVGLGSRTTATLQTQWDRDGSNFKVLKAELVDADLQPEDADALSKKVANSVTLFKKEWSAEASATLLSGKVTVQAKTYDGSAEAAFLRVAAKATGQCMVGPGQLKISGELSAAFSAFEGKVQVNSYSPDRDGQRLMVPKDFTEDWDNASNLIDLGAFRMRMSMSMGGFIGAQASLGGDITFGVDADGNPAMKAGAGVEAKCFAGAKVDASLGGAMQWMHPNFDELPVAQRKLAVGNDKFFELGGITVAGSASFGIGASASLRIGWDPKDKKYVIRASASLTFGPGLGGSVDIGIDPMNIWILADFLYNALRQCDLKTLVFIGVATYLSITAALAYLAIRGVFNLVVGLGNLIAEAGEAIGSWLFGSKALGEAHALAGNLRKMAIVNPSYFMNLPPETRGRLLDLLTHSAVFDGEEDIEDAILIVLRPITTRREYEKILEAMYKCEKYQGDMEQGKAVKLQDRAKAQAGSEARLHGVLDGNEQTAFNNFVQDLASGAAKDTKLRKIEKPWLQSIMGQTVCQQVAASEGVTWDLSGGDAPQDDRLSASARVTSVSWSKSTAYVNSTVRLTANVVDIRDGAEATLKLFEDDYFGDDYVQTHKSYVENGKIVFDIELNNCQGESGGDTIYPKLEVIGKNYTYTSKVLTVKLPKFSKGSWKYPTTVNVHDTATVQIEHKGFPKGVDIEIELFDSDTGPANDDFIQKHATKTGANGKTELSFEIQKHDGEGGSNDVYFYVRTTSFYTGETKAKKVLIETCFDDSYLTVREPKITSASWAKDTVDVGDYVKIDLKAQGYPADTKVVIAVWESDVGPGNDDYMETAVAYLDAAGRASVNVHITRTDGEYFEGDNELYFVTTVKGKEQTFDDKYLILKN